MTKRADFAHDSGRRGIRPAFFYGMFALLLAGNAATGTALLLAPDIARLLDGRTGQLIAAYEDRITALSVEVDRLHSRNFAQAGDINLQLQELSQQQDMLLEQHQLVKVLVDRANRLGIETAALPAANDDTPLDRDGNPDIAETAATLNRMMDETQSAMTAISEAADQRTETIVAGLSDIGIAVDLPRAIPDGMGGPLLPPVDDAATAPVVEDANAVLAALMRYKAARGALEAAPIHMPLTGRFRQSSGFGNRTDPFSGARAFHAGLDFAAPSGTTVFSAGAGVVTFVGQKSGYGNLVEITHENGLVTRYGHLSAFIAAEGQKVEAGTPIARVGSTGRSTGPHLHFEVRKSDSAVDPTAYLNAGKRLSPLLG